MSERPGQERVKPKDCAIAVALPSSFERFQADRSALKKDFVRNCCTTWAKYQHDVVRPMASAVRDAESYGVAVFSDVTFERFIDLCKDEEFKVVILFAHWTERSIEFSDGLRSAEEIDDHIPSSTTSVLDLCVCCPEALANARAVRAGFDTRYNESLVTPRIWFAFYRFLFRFLSTYDISYFKAFGLTVDYLSGKEIA